MQSPRDDAKDEEGTEDSEEARLEHEREDALVDEQGRESFPASDPPAN